MAQGRPLSQGQPVAVPARVGRPGYLQLAASQPCTGAIAFWSLPLENTVWSLMPAMATWLRVVKSALMLSGARSAVRLSSALVFSSSAAVPWEAARGSRVELVACSEILVQASAAVAKPPHGPEDLLGLAVAVDGAGLAAADDGALPASGAEQAVSARAARRMETVSGRAAFLKISCRNHFSVEIAPPARSRCRRSCRSFPSVRV